MFYMYSDISSWNKFLHCLSLSHCCYSFFCSCSINVRIWKTPTVSVSVFRNVFPFQSLSVHLNHPHSTLNLPAIPSSKILSSLIPLSSSWHNCFDCLFFREPRVALQDKLNLFLIFYNHCDNISSVCKIMFVFFGIRCSLMVLLSMSSVCLRLWDPWTQDYSERCGVEGISHSESVRG